MRYERPQIIALALALVSVQASNKPAPHIVDSELGSGYTAAAYEADE